MISRNDGKNHRNTTQVVVNLNKAMFSPITYYYELLIYFPFNVLYQLLSNLEIMSNGVLMYFLVLLKYLPYYFLLFGTGILIS